MPFRFYSILGPVPELPPQNDAPAGTPAAAAKRRLKVSIRYKIVALIAVALAASLASYLYLGTNLVTQDKTTYLFDFALNQLHAASQPIDYRISNVVGAARALGAETPREAGEAGSPDATDRL